MKNSKSNVKKLPSSCMLGEFTVLLAVLINLLVFSGCTKEEIDIDEESVLVIDDTEFTIDDWTESTHGKGATPDFDEVFNDAAVKRLDIVITAERWSSMISNLNSIYGRTSGPGGGASFSDEDPIFVPAEIFYNDKQWYRVGVRFKGNSSLRSAWQAGIVKLSFKLDFDEFEDDYAQIDDQRFYGFKKLSLKNNFDDESFLREKIASEVFSNSGLAVSHTAFYVLYVDYGDGPQYFGLYTMVEEVGDTVIETQFASDEGNLYKPEGNGASFINETFNQSDFEKKTNEDEEDWSDIKSLFSALHDGSRISDPGVWRTGLDEVFDTDVFLKYLAVNTVIQNWDTYGRMTQNYFLYNNPDNGKLTWIPWDNNEALQEGKQGGALALDFSDLQSGNWPLIEYLYDDDVYKAKYDSYLAETIAGPFEVSAMQSLYDNYAALIEPYATSEITGFTFLESVNDFPFAISSLKQHVASRTAAVTNYLK